MGLDFLDFTLTLEKKHNICVSVAVVEDIAKAFEKVAWNRCNGRRDMRVGRFYEALRPHCFHMCSACRALVNTSQRRPLKSRPARDECPQCGEKLRPAELSWAQACEALGAVTGCIASKIEREQWLRKDLKFF